MNQAALINWINTHDCGVTPTAVVRGDDLVIRVEAVISATDYGQAREALGY